MIVLMLPVRAHFFSCFCQSYVVWFCLLFGGMSAGCAGPAQITVLSGSCGDLFEQCMSRCASRKDTLDCELMCRFRGKKCEGFQSTRTKRAQSSELQKIGGYEAQLVDFSEAKPLVSKGAKLEFKGTVKTGSKRHVLFPGAQVSVDFSLPDTIRQAELVLRHGPGGAGTKCYITMVVGPKLVLGRYAPPRLKTGRLKGERWNLTQEIESWQSVDGKKTVRLIIKNNQKTGSAEPYHLRSIELYYRAYVPRD